MDRFKKAFQPSENVCADEYLLAYRGNIPFRVYIANKPNKIGIKIHIVSDCDTNYAWNAKIYGGKIDEKLKKDKSDKRPYGVQVENFDSKNSKI